MKSGKNPQKYVVIVQEWLESEAGWGQRPDGYSLHLTREDLAAFVKEYWAGMPKDVCQMNIRAPKVHRIALRLMRRFILKLRQARTVSVLLIANYQEG